MQDDLQLRLQYKRTLVIAPASILAGQSVSNLVDLGGMQLRAIVTPANWTSSDISFKISYDGITIATCANFDISKFILPNVPLSWATPVIPSLFDGYPYIQLETIIPQINAVQVALLLQPLYKGL